MSSGPRPACSYAGFAIESRNGVSGTPTPNAESVEKFGISITVFGYCGVIVETPAIFAGSVECLRAYSSLVSTSAAPPSLVAQIWRRRSGSDTIGEFRTSSIVNAFL